METLHKISLFSISFFLLILNHGAMALPTGEEVVSGQFKANSVQNNGNGQSLTINQTSEKGILNWQDFSIGKDELVQFIQPVQPGRTSMTLNRVTGTNPSSILGQLTANGQVILINRAGVIFGPKATVNIAGLIATTAQMTDTDFLSGNYYFQQDNTKTQGIIQQGVIQTNTDHGNVVLMAPYVENTGVIQANLGKVALSSGSAYTVNFSGNNLVNFEVGSSSATSGLATDAQGNPLTNGVINSGTITANGGSVLMSTQAAQNVVSQVTNYQGVIQADTMQDKQGTIILSGGAGSQVSVSGTLSAQGKNPGEKGGTIKVLGDKISVGQDAPAIIDASGKAGGGTVLIGGNYQGKGPEKNALETTVSQQTQLLTNATEKGDGGKVVVYSEGKTEFHGTAEAKGGPEGGNGGSIETSGATVNISGASISAGATHGEDGEWLLDPYDITLGTNEMATISSILNTGTNVTINTDAPYGSQSSTGTGNITLQAPTGDVFYVWRGVYGESGYLAHYDNNTITWNTSATLSLLAQNNIIFQGGRVTPYTTDPVTSVVYSVYFPGAGIHATNGGQLVLEADIGHTGVGTIQFGNANRGGAEYNGNNDPYGRVFNSGDQKYNGPYILLQNGSSAILDYNPPASSVPKYSGLTTSDFNPYITTDVTSSYTPQLYVNNLSDLQAMNNNLAINYVLSQDINASATAGWNNGAGFVPIGTLASPFTGSFEGNDSVISNLYINSPNGTAVGLFGALNGTATSPAMVENLGLENSTIIGDQRVGGIAGFARNAQLTNVYNTGTVYATENTSYGSHVGGIVGLAQNVSITNAYNTGYISTRSIGTVGGIIGWASGGGALTDVYQGGSALGQNGNALVGGGDGKLNSLGDYWDTSTSGQSSGVMGSTGLPTSGMMQSSSYSGWDFTNTWGIVVNPSGVGISYPYFQWRYPTTPPKIVSGTWNSAVGGGIPMSLAVNGNIISTAYTGANSSIYYLLAPGTYNGNDSTKNLLLLYSQNPSDFANTFIKLSSTSGTGSVTGAGVPINQNTVVVTSQNNVSVSNTDLANALPTSVGSGSSILYSMSGTSVNLPANKNFTIQGSTPFVFNGNVTAIGGTINIGGTGTLGGDVTLTGADLQLKGSTINGKKQYDLTLDFPTIYSLDGQTTNYLIGDQLVDVQDLTFKQLTSLQGNLTTLGNQTYDHGLQLTADTSLTGADLQLKGSTINGKKQYDLTLDFPTIYSLNGQTTNYLIGDQLVGVQDLTFKQLTSLQGNLTTLGNQTYDHGLQLAGNTALVAGADKNIEFQSATPLQSMDGTARSLTTTTSGNGQTIFSGGLGDTNHPISTLTVEGKSTVENNMTTTGDQEYKDAVTLGAPVGSTIQFQGTGAGSTIEFDSTVKGPNNLTLKNPVILGGDVITTNTGGDVRYAQTYEGDVALGSDILLRGSKLGLNGHNISGNNWLHSLQLDFSNPLSLLGSQFSGLNNFEIDPTGATTSIAGTFETLGNQIYGNPVQLMNDVTIKGHTPSGARQITFNDTVNGSHGMTFDVGSQGNVLFNGNVGTSATPLTWMEIMTANNFENRGNMYLNGNFTQDSGTGKTSLSGNEFGMHFGSNPGTGSLTADDVYVNSAALTGKAYTNQLVFPLSLSYVDLASGSINGKVGLAGAWEIITHLPSHRFSPGKYFYDNIDLGFLVLCLNDPNQCFPEKLLKEPTARWRSMVEAKHVEGDVPRYLKPIGVTLPDQKKTKTAKQK